MEQIPLEQAYALMQEHISKITNPVIFELGMCDGYHTWMMLHWCTSRARYYGFEPDPRNVSKIVASRNGDTPLTHVINFYPHAVGNVTGRVNFHLSTPEPNGCVGASSISEFTDVLTKSWSWLRCQETIEVEGWRLDDFCAQRSIDHIDFLWMDVQGAERLVFDGAPEMLKKTSLLWTEYDGGTLYKDSSTIQDVLARFPDWKVLGDCGGDVLLKNPNV